MSQLSSRQRLIKKKLTNDELLHKVAMERIKLEQDKINAYQQMMSKHNNSRRTVSSARRKRAKQMQQDYEMTELQKTKRPLKLGYESADFGGNTRSQSHFDAIVYHRKKMETHLNKMKELEQRSHQQQLQLEDRMSQHSGSNSVRNLEKPYTIKVTSGSLFKPEEQILPYNFDSEMPQEPEAAFR